MVGDATAWASVLGGRVSLATALRQGHLRLSGAAPDAEGVPGMSLPQPLLGDMRIPILTQLIAPALTADALAGSANGH